MRTVGTLALVASIVVAAACSSSTEDTGAPPGSSPPPSGGGTGTSGGSAAPPNGGDAGSPSPGSSGDAAAPTGGGDPFAPQPDTSQGLTNVSADLGAVLEGGALASACAQYDATKSDRKAMLLCGKAMFFYEGFGTGGVPKTFATFLLDNFPDEIGPGFSKLGMVADPNSSEHLPLGLAPGAKLGGADTLAFTCASCHFAQLPDGRYAVGAPNHAYQYGKMNLALAVFPVIGAGLSQPSDHDPDAVKMIQPLLDKVSADASLKTKLYGALLPLLGAMGSAPKFPKEAEHLYSTWKTGTMDFFIEPLPFNDHVHTISKISALWGLPNDAEVQQSGMTSAMLGWTGGTASLTNFAEGFVDLGGGVLADWPVDKVRPLVEYVYSLRAPSNPKPDDAQTVAKGAQLFAAKGCTDCHDGPRGAGKHVYTYEQIGTDPQMKLWADPDQTGKPEYGIRFQPGDSVTHALKSPRLVGLWAMTRFLHNGSVDTLEDLLCTNKPRGDLTTPAYGNQGHTYGCELGADDKKALVAFLKSH